MKVEEDLALLLNKRRNNGGYRKLRKPKESLIDFSSNDYLGLAKIEEINKIPSSFVDNGAAGSRLLSGNKPYHEEVEDYLSNFFKAPAALLFNSGYMANLGVLSSIPQKGDVVLMDELSHICIKEGVRLSRAKYFNFRHNDLADLEAKLERVQAHHVFIVVESVYSMDGDQAPLKEIVKLSKKYNASLIVDEAHTTALHGESGFGLCCDLGIENEVFARIYTFGKAAGAHGAVVCGSEIIKEYLVNYSRQFIYTTALPYHSVSTIQNAMEYRRQHPELWSKLLSNIEAFKSGLSTTVPKLDSRHPIQGVIMQNSESTVNFANYLTSAGFDIRPILSPTVPKGEERVRICLHAFNSEQEITTLCNHINQYFK